MKYKLAGKRVLVTGGAGFIGSHLVEELLQSGVNVTVADIAVAPRSYFSVQQLYKHARTEVIDITDKEGFDRIMASVKPDFVFHLAAEAIVADAYKNPYRTFMTNVMGTVTVLESARKYSPEGVIVASSDKAYGKTKETYTEDSPIKGDHPYDVSKSCTDLIAQTYHATYGMPVAISRFGNVYGEGDLHFDRIIPGIAKAIIADETLAIRSDGKYVRDYVYVKDVARGYIFLAEKIKKTQGEAYNFSSNDTFSVIELIDEIKKVLGLSIKYEIQNTAHNEIPYQHLDDAKIRNLGWESSHSVGVTIQGIVDWYRNIM